MVSTRSENYNVLLLRSAYRIPEGILREAVARLGYAAIESRLLAADCDGYLEPRPAAHSAGWMTVCDAIAASDDQYQSSDEYINPADMHAAAGRRLAEMIKAKRTTFMLQPNEWTEARRCELASAHGAKDCLQSAVKVFELVDSETPSREVAAILKKNAGHERMSEFIRGKKAYELDQQVKDACDKAILGGGLW